MTRYWSISTYLAKIVSEKLYLRNNIQSKQSAKDAKRDVENTPKCTRLIGILATRSCPPWPSDDDDKEEDDVCHLVVAALLLDLANLTKLSENIVHTQQRWALCIGSYCHYYQAFRFRDLPIC